MLSKAAVGLVMRNILAWLSGCTWKTWNLPYLREIDDESPCLPRGGNGECKCHKECSILLNLY